MQPEPIKVVVVDDHPIVLQGLKTLFTHEKNMSVTGCFTAGAGLLDFLKTEKTDVVLLDISLPDSNGIDLCAEIKKEFPGTLVLILSNHSERSMIMQTIQNGASGYLLKNSSPEELARCINEALDGRIAFSKEVREIISRPTKNELKGVAKLTKREKQILKLLAEGKTSSVIADELFVSPLTVDSHRRNLLQKFEVNNVAALMREAAQQHLL